jgi:hypothetical protein
MSHAKAQRREGNIRVYPRLSAFIRVYPRLSAFKNLWRITVKKAFRKYHRIIGIIVCVPLFLTVLTGMLATIIGEWSVNIGLSPRLMLKIHTGEIFHLQGIYPILNGFGLIGLLVTGMSMSGLFNQQKKPNHN